MAEIESGRIIAAYLKIRNEKQAYVKASDAIVAEYDAKLDRLSAELLNRMNKSKLKSLRGEAGIAVKTRTIIPTGSDWDAFYAWVVETNNFEALERRIKKTFIETYMEENDQELPPGVSVMKSFKAIIKKAPSTKGIADAEE